MTKKTFLLTAIMAMATLAAAAQPDGAWRMRVYGLFDTHYGSRDLGGIAAVAERDLGAGYTIGGGAELATSARYSLSVYGRASLGKGFTLQNRYLYRQFANLNRQEFAGALLLGYSNRHWLFSVGFANRYTAALVQRSEGGMGTVVEPMNLTFSIEGWLFERTAAWNVGGRFSNMNDFMMERMTVWTYSLLGYYTMPSGMRLDAEVAFHPAGSLNLTATYDGFAVRAGTAWNF